MLFHQPFNSLSNYNYNISVFANEIWEYHFHKNFELIYVLEGNVDCTVNSNIERLTVGDFGLCMPYDIHRYVPHENTRYWVLVFSEDFVRTFAREVSGKMGNGFLFRPDNTVKNYFLERLVHNTSPTIFTLKSCLYALCEEYLNCIELIDRNQKELDAITAITDYVQKNHTQKLSLSDIARKLGYDYNYTSRFFKKMFNMSFTDFVNLYRLETAIKLLEETEQSVLSVAFESGFQSVRSFNDFFKKTIGISPSEYKKTSRIKEILHKN